ncbi:uncharacterized protein LOC135391470 isoform X2 [Ornithodoros turicata]
MRDTSNAEDDVEPSVTKLKERSSIWKYFRRATRSSAECDACKFVLQTPTGTTTPLVNQLKRHPALLKEYNDAKASQRDQPTLKDLLRGTEPLPAKKRCALNSKLTAMVALNLQPYSIVEDRGFRELMSEAVPSYRLPCRSTLKGLILDELNAHATWSELEGELIDFEQSANNVAATSSQVWNAFDNLANSDEVFEPEREVEGYANDVLLKRDLSPCQWWQTTGRFSYPHLAQLCYRYLAIPATSVPSERAFSAAGAVVCARRERLLPEHVEQLVFLHNNL